MTRDRAAGILLLAVATGLAATAVAQPVPEPDDHEPSAVVMDDPAVHPVAELGRQRFAVSCANCHGEDARGGGPLGRLLVDKPKDLTLLARNNAGSFPFERVYEAIDGERGPAAHGSPGSPIWGTLVNGTGSAPTRNRGRILEIILYLRSIQRK